MTRRTDVPRRLRSMLGLSALMILGCGSDRTKPPDFHLSGHIHYEYVPYERTNEGLDYSRIMTRPVRGARVLLLDAANDNILAESTSSVEGAYVFAWAGSTKVKLWVIAETTEPNIVVVDNTALNAKYVLESAPIFINETPTFDVVVRSGWTGNSYGEPRQSAPFTILDAAYSAAKRFLDEGTPTPVFPPLEINWSVENRPEKGLVTLGKIGTSHWDDSEIYILGKEDVDTDEFDTHVIVHEWGHAFEQFFSRTDNLGGLHGFGKTLDPRIAFSEGFCSALSAMILDPNTVYSDSSGLQQQDGFSEDIDENDTSFAAKPGWYSETSVQNILFDLYDNDQTGVESFDEVAIGIGGMYAAMTGTFRTTPAMTTLFPFVTTVKNNHNDVAAAIDTLVTHHGNGTSFGIDPIQDEWGTNESHGGDEPGAIPVYVMMNLGDSKKLTLTGGLNSAFLGQNRFLRFTGNGASVQVSTASVEDVDLFVYHLGVEVAQSATSSGNESATLSTNAGEQYVINVEGHNATSGPYDVTVSVTP